MAQKQIDHYQTKYFDIVIFSKDYYAVDNLDPDLKIRFTPTRSQVDSCENALLNDSIRGNIGQDSMGKMRVYYSTFKKNTLAMYKRQYFGFIDSNGNKIIIINAISCREEEEILRKWVEAQISLEDGDTWVVKYNLSTKKLYDFISGVTL
jgi:hypothetical protein